MGVRLTSLTRWASSSTVVWSNSRITSPIASLAAVGGRIRRNAGDAGADGPGQAQFGGHRRTELAVQLHAQKGPVTLPVSINCRATTMNMLMGMAKPMPSLPPELLAMAVLMPMISPRRLHQRAAAVARIDGGVGLQEVLEADRRRRPTPGRGGPWR